MKTYFAPEAEIYEYKLIGDILGASNYGGDEIVDEETDDPFMA